MRGTNQRGTAKDGGTLRSHHASSSCSDAHEWMGHHVEHFVQAMDPATGCEEVLASALLRLRQRNWARLAEEEEWGGLKDRGGRDQVGIRGVGQEGANTLS